MVMKSDGRIFTAGYGWQGALGRGSDDEDRASSSSFVQADVPGHDSDNVLAALYSNSHHILVLKSDGSVVGWGNDGEGQLAGHGGGQPSAIPELGNDNAHFASQYHFTVILKNS